MIRAKEGLDLMLRDGYSPQEIFRIMTELDASPDGSPSPGKKPWEADWDDESPSPGKKPWEAASPSPGGAFPGAATPFGKKEWEEGDDETPPADETPGSPGASGGKGGKGGFPFHKREGY